MMTFLRFNAAAFLTFLLELGILYYCAHALALPYLAAVAIAFVSTTLIEYALCHLWVFARSGRRVPVEYGYFMSILTGGLLWALLLVWLFVATMGVSTLVGRILSGILTGLWDYYLNARFNFRAHPFLRRQTSNRRLHPTA